MRLPRASLGLDRSRFTTLLRHGALGALIAGALVALSPVAALAVDPDIGYEGPSMLNAGTDPSGSKPESKLWWNDGSWWAVLWDAVAADFHIFRLDETVHQWIDSGVPVDTRSGTRADVLWSGSKLYVASHNFSNSDGSGESRLYRYSYDGASDAYSLDSGFPAVINGVRSETLVIARDSTGKLWATWEQNGSIWINRTTGSGTAFDNSWGTPFAMPGAAGVAGDDISSILAFGGDRIGLMWSNQSTSLFYFAVHADGQPDTTWGAIETAGNLADDHINLKTDAAGRVFAAIKTSLSPGGPSPLIVLLVRSSSGNWWSYTVAIAEQDHTRPIVLLDETNGVIHVVMTGPQLPATSGAGEIYQKTSPIGSISFPAGYGTPVINDTDSASMNNATSTKQNVNPSMGLYVVAGNEATDRYWTTVNLLGGPPPSNNPPSAANKNVTATVGTPLTITLTGTHVETCNLTFSTLSSPTKGTLGPVGNVACAPGSPYSDSATIVYTPTGATGADSFTYRTNDGTDDSPTATVDITVNPAPSPQIDFRSSSSGSSVAATAIDLPAPAGVASGDVLIASIALRGNADVSPPAGWTLVRIDINSTTMRLATYVKVAGGSEPGTYTFTFSKSTSAAAGGISAYTGVDPANPIDVHGGGVNATASTSVLAPSVTTTVANAMLLAIFGSANDATATPPGGMTERYDVLAVGTSKVADASADETRGAAGATGSRTATLNKSTTSIGQLVALRPAP